MEVKKVNIEDKKLSSEIDLSEELLRVPRSIRSQVRDDVGEYIVEKILLDVANQRSPVTGKGFKGLSKEYGKKKKDKTGSDAANLDLTGAMLGELNYKTTSQGVEVGVFGKEAPKADGHNNLSGESNLPTRRFLPDVGESFRSEIDSGIKKIIQDAISENSEITKEDFEDVESKADLYETLTGIFGELSRADLRAAVLRSESILEILEETDTLKWL